MNEASQELNVWKCRDCDGSGYRPEHESACMTCHGIGMVSAYEINKLREQNALLTKQVEKLSAFKAYVHDYLDKKSIARDPPGEHKDAGCRIGQRLDLVFALMADLEDARDSALFDLDVAKRLLGTAVIEKAR